MKCFALWVDDYFCQIRRRDEGQRMKIRLPMRVLEKTRAVLRVCPVLVGVLLTPAAVLAASTTVKFSYADYKADRTKIQKVFAENYAEVDRVDSNLQHEIKSPAIGITEMDINGDGRPEVLAYLSSHGFCGTSGCAFIIFSRDNTGELHQLDYLVAYEDIKILPSSHHKFSDFLMRRLWPAKGDEIYSLWQWDGERYSCNDCQQNK